MQPQFPATGILLAAFGATTQRGEPALAAFAARVRDAFPGIPIRWAFTAKNATKLPELCGDRETNVASALEAFAQEGVRAVAVQPLHVVPGHEHAALNRLVAAWQKNTPNTTSVMGAPLLTDDASLAAALAAMRRIETEEIEQDEVAVWVGHGSKTPECFQYTRLADMANAAAPPIRMGWLSEDRAALSMCARLAATKTTKICLMSFFTLSGGHAVRDVGGDDENSWKSLFEKNGFRCRVKVKSLLERDAFAAMWLNRLNATLNELQTSA